MEVFSEELVTGVISLKTVRKGIFKQTQILTRALAPEYMHEPNQVSILYGKLISLGSFGQTLGSFIGGYTIEKFPRSGFTFLCGFLSIFFGINAALINSLPETKTKDEKDEDKPDTYKGEKLDSVTEMSEAPGVLAHDGMSMSRRALQVRQ
ncbi:unnamed protein product [Spodoptera exigua]|nr:unnamed protein product [Spodoptera exigua]